MRALIDGDLILYRAAHAVQSRMYIVYNERGEPFACSPRKKDLPPIRFNERIRYTTMVDEDGYDEACGIICSMLDKIKRRTGSSRATIYLSGEDNFRHRIYPEYKAGRPPKPLLYSALKRYMLTLNCTVLVHGQEADDALGIAQTTAVMGDFTGKPLWKESVYPTTICSYDKDLRMIPGRHYDFKKDILFTVTEEEGMLAFYKQLLTGDSTDNIPGLEGVGPKTAAKILEGIDDEKGMYLKVVSTYEGREVPFEDITRNARLLWIRRQEEELWTPPC